MNKLMWYHTQIKTDRFSKYDDVQGKYYGVYEEDVWFSGCRNLGVWSYIHEE